MAAVNGTYDLEQGVFSAIPGLVGKALGPARKWFNGALEWVCGDPKKLTETGQQYVKLGDDVVTLSTELQQLVDGVPSWQGPASVEFHKTMGQTVDVVNKIGGFVAKTNEILTAAAEIATEAANIIWDLVVELVKWLVQTLLTALASSTISFGATIAAWLGAAVGQVARVVGVVGKVVSKVGTFLKKIITLLQKLIALINKFKAVLDKVAAILRKVKELYDKVKPLTKLGEKVPAGTTWEDYKNTHAPTGSSVRAPGSVPGGTASTPGWTPSVSTPNVTAGNGSDWQYEGGYGGGTGAAGVGSVGSVGSSPSGTAQFAGPGSTPGGVATGAFGSGSPGSVSTGSYGTAGYTPGSVGTQAANLSGGVGGVGGAPLLGAGGSGGASGGGAGAAPRGGTAAAGMGGGVGGGMMPMGGVAAGGGGSSQTKSSQNLAKGETPLAAAPAGGAAPIGAPAKKEKRKVEGQGVLTTARLGEEHDEKAAEAAAGGRA